MENKEELQLKAFDEPAVTHKTCGTCEHLCALEYRSGSRFFYCSLRKSAQTNNGMLKVKCKTIACISYKQAEGKKIKTQKCE